MLNPKVSVDGARACVCGSRGQPPSAAMDGLDDSSSDEEIYGTGVKMNKRLDRDMTGAFHQKASDEGGQIDVSNGKGQVYKRLRKAGKGFENPMLGWEIVFTYR